ncbi:MAG: hypothetical protein M3220_18895 [Chloroflexota bacterium]|nr:hypothetical protein [Chloroflexota bacterium]
MSDTAKSTRRHPLVFLLLSLVGTVALLLGWAIFAQYRVHHAGLAL